MGQCLCSAGSSNHDIAIDRGQRNRQILQPSFVKTTRTTRTVNGQVELTEGNVVKNETHGYGDTESAHIECTPQGKVVDQTVSSDVSIKVETLDTTKINLTRSNSFHANNKRYAKVKSWGRVRSSSISQSNIARTTPLNSSISKDDSINSYRQRLILYNSQGGVRRLRLSSTMSSDGKISRLNSDLSNDNYYDCRSNWGSTFDDAVSIESKDNPKDDKGQLHVASEYLDLICNYSDGLCVYDDGTPAAVPVGTCTSEIPAAYVTLFGKTKSETKWIETQRWRIDNNVWKTHRLPHPWFQKIKAAYPHYVHGYTKMGYPVVYEKPGAMKLKELFREGLQVSDMLRHYIFFMEFLNNVICNRPEIRALLDNRSKKDSSSTWGFFVVMDVEGASLSAVMSGNVVKYMKQAGDTNTNHYPTSMKRCILVNAPMWLSGAFSSMKYIVPENVQVEIHSTSRHLIGLREYINDDQIPREYGGSSMYALGDHPFETDLNDLVERALKSPVMDQVDPSMSDMIRLPLYQNIHMKNRQSRLRVNKSKH